MLWPIEIRGYSMRAEDGYTDAHVHPGCQEGVGPPQARLTSSSDVVTASRPLRAPERQHECAERHTAAHGQRKTQALEL